MSDWVSQSKCKTEGMDPNFFFPKAKTGRRKKAKDPGLTDLTSLIPFIKRPGSSGKDDLSELSDSLRPTNIESADTQVRGLEIAEAEVAKYCSDCPVISECLEWALNTGQEYGVAGGRTSAERARLTKRLLLRASA